MPTYTADFLYEYKSPIGILILVSNGKELTELRLGNTLSFSGINSEDFRPDIITETIYWLNSYFTGKNPSYRQLSLSPSGSEFRRSVWNKLLEIPYGTTVSYGDIAKLIANERSIPKMSAQAIGDAVKHNPIQIIIPCHRVIGADRNLTGFSCGMNIKIALLKHEGVDMSRMFMPNNNKGYIK